MTTVLYLSTMGAISGAERSLLSLLDALDQAQWQPLVTAPEGELLREVAKRAIETLPAPFASLSRPHTLRRWLTTWRDWRDGQQVLQNILYASRPQIVHANTTSAMLTASDVDDLPVIWQVRDLVPLGWIGRKLYQRAARVAVISPAVRTDVLSYADDDGKKIILLPPAVDLALFRPAEDRRRVREQLGLPVDLPLIGMSAQFVPWKRHHLFLDALERIIEHPWHAVLTGANLHGDLEYLETIRARLEQPPLTGRISWLPWQQNAARLTSALDISVLTSQREPFGRVLIEAMACAVPVVAVNEGGPTDIIVHEMTGLLTTADADDIADAMHRLLADAEMRERFGTAGRARATDLFSLEHQRQALNTLYNSV